MVNVIDGNSSIGAYIDGNAPANADIIDGNGPDVTEALVASGPSVIPRADTRTVTLESLDGSIVIPLNTDTERIVLGGVTGVGLPPRDVGMDSSPGMAGSTLQEITVRQREVFIPLKFASDSSQADFFAKLAELRALIDPTTDVEVGSVGTFRLVVGSLLGERLLTVVYSSGWEGNWGGDASGARWEKFGLTLIAVDPYWRARKSVELTYKAAPGGVFLGSGDNTHPWPRRLAASVVVGAGMQVPIEGDVAAWPEVELHGPAPFASLAWPGTSVVMPTGVPDGSTLLLRTDERVRSARLDGVIAWSRIQFGATFLPLRPGVNTIDVELGSSGAGAELTLRYTPAFKTAY
jgi:hypothetical protein